LPEPDDDLTPARAEDLRACIGLALTSDGRLAKTQSAELMASIVAERLVARLERDGFVIMQGPRGALAHLRVALCNPLRAHNQGSGLATEPFVRRRVPQSLSEEDLMRGMVMGLSTLATVALPAVGLADGDGAVTGAVGGAVAGAVVVVVAPAPVPMAPCSTRTTTTSDNTGNSVTSQTTNCPD
jgi:hypothetical protein